MPSSNALAYFADGNSLLERCREPSRAAALHFSVGAVDMALALNNKDFCIPENVNAGQLSDVICKYVRDTPEERHLPAAFMIILGLQKAWPCK